MKLQTRERTDSTAWLRTMDGKYDVLGDDLNTNTPAGRAAGAGSVWGWRLACARREYWAGGGATGSTPERWFATKAACLEDLRQHIASQPADQKVIAACQTCGRRNRYDPLNIGLLKCGACGARL